MKIASWNVNSLNVRLPHLQQWLGTFVPDVVGIQETKLEDHKFPDTVLAEAGYRSVFAGQKTYNGVAIVSRLPIDDVQIGIPGFEDEQKRAIAATVGYDGLTGVMGGFNEIGEVVKPVQVQVVKEGLFRHFGVVDDPELIKP